MTTIQRMVNPASLVSSFWSAHDFILPKSMAQRLFPIMRRQNRVLPPFLSQQQLHAIKDKIPAETYQTLKGLNWGNYIASQLRKANFDDHLQHIVTKLLTNPASYFEVTTQTNTDHWMAALVHQSEMK
ncbi:hypothetical protein [Stieleria bergensis]